MTRPARFGSLVLLTAPLALLAVACSSAPEPSRALRVCADPNNLPFSNDRQEGFENRIAEILAREMNARVEYTWWAQRRGFVRNTLRAGSCDVIIGVPREYDPVRTTRPYYRSTYVFVSQRDRHLQVTSFDDPRLRTLRVGVHIIGDDYANAPPAHALSRRQIISNVVGYSIYGNYLEPNPPARLVEAVAKGDVDLAVVWGPLAGYFAKRQAVPLELSVVTPDVDPPDLPLAYDIAMGVRRDDEALQVELNRILERRAEEIQAVLAEFGVPLVGTPRGALQAAEHRR